MTILQGAELNIGTDGSVDYDPEFLADLDFGVASVHSAFTMDRSRQTARVIAAMHNPAVNAIGHLTGRRIGRRPGIELDVDAVLAAAFETGCALEINGHLDRLDPPVEVLRHARERGVTFTIASDGHDIRELSNVSNAVRHGRRGWIEKSQVANTWTAKQFLKWAGDKREG